MIPALVLLLKLVYSCFVASLVCAGSFSVHVIKDFFIVLGPLLAIFNVYICLSWMTKECAEVKYSD